MGLNVKKSLVVLERPERGILLLLREKLQNGLKTNNNNKKKPC